MDLDFARRLPSNATEARLSIEDALVYLPPPRSSQTIANALNKAYDTQAAIGILQVAIDLLQQRQY